MAGIVEWFVGLIADVDADREARAEAERARAAHASDRLWFQSGKLSQRGDHSAAAVLSAESGRQQAKAWGWEPKSKSTEIWKGQK